MNRLIIKLNTITENVTSELISKLYTNAKEIKDYEELNEIEDSLVLLLGNLQTLNAYDDEVTYLETKFPNLHINVTGGRYVKFEDPEVLRVLLTTYGDGTGITMSDMLAISNIGTLFKGNTTITKFNEFRYFTGITNRITNWSIGDWFNGCINLREITIPKNVEKIVADSPPFNNCTSLETVIFDIDSVITECPKFSGCTSLTNISLPNSITTIIGSGFYGCSSLVQFNTNNVTYILSSAFKYCLSLTSITLSNVTRIGSEAFVGCQALTTVTFNTQTLTLIDGISFEGCSNLVINDLNLPNLTSLGSGAFNETKIKQISNLGTITSIPNNVFQSCSQLTSVILPNTVTTIGNYSFRGCSSLTSIDLSNITSIGENTFLNCSALTTVNLSSCTSLGGSVFRDCSSLTSVIDLNITTISSNNNFRNCSALTSINLSNVTSLGSDTFNGCTSLGTGQTLDLNLSNLTFYPETAFRGTKYSKLILHCPLLTGTMDTRYPVWQGMSNVTYIDLSDFLIAKSRFNNSLYVCSGPEGDTSIVTFIYSSNVTDIGTSLKYGRLYNTYRYAIILATTPPNLETTDHNNPPSVWFYNSNLHIYVPDSAKAAYLADTDWATIGGYNGSDTIADRLHGLSELPAGVWTTGLASLYLTPALLATS